MIRYLMSVILAASVVAGPAMAQKRPAKASGGNAYEIGKAGAWGIFRSGEGRSKSCFIMSQPSERLPKGLNRDPARSFISMSQGEANKVEFSTMTGYGMKPGADVQISVGSTVFSGIGQKETVWLKNPAEEGRLITEMRKNGAFSVKGVSARGNETTDRYSLTGFSQALERAQKECS